MLFVLGVIVGLLISILILIGLLYFKPELTYQLKKLENKTKQKGLILDEEQRKDKVLKMFGL